MKKLRAFQLFSLSLGFVLFAATAQAKPPPPPPGGGPPPAPKKGKKGKKAPPPPPGAEEEESGSSEIVTGNASAAQKSAETAYNEDDFEEAANVFYSITAQKKSGDPARAQFWFGKALFQLGFYAGSLSVFDEIVNAGPQHPYYRNTLPWLASLSRHLPEGSGVLEKIGKYRPSELENEAYDSVRDELYYLLGRYYYRTGDLGNASALLSQVPQESDFYIPAQYFLGVAETREFRGPEAVEAFKNVLRKNIEMRKDMTHSEARKLRRLAKRRRKKSDISSAELDFYEKNQRLEQLANIALGYIFYQVGKFEVGIKYFDRVPIDSPYRLDAVFAAAWSEFRLVEAEEDAANRHYQRTLGYVHTLNAPFFYDYLYPESLIIKAVTYYFNCRYGQAKEAIDEFSRRYVQTKKDLQSVLDKAPDDFALYDLTVAIRESKSELDPFVEKVARNSLQDKDLEKHYQYVERLDYEQNTLLPEMSGSFSKGPGEFISENFDVVMSVAKEQTGALARERLAFQISEIKKLERQAIMVEYEILNKLKTLGDESEGARQKPVVDKEHEIYNYNGEYWQDELGYYYYKVTNACQD